MKHFAAFADQTNALQNVVDDFPGGVCIPNVTCPIFPDTGNLVILRETVQVRSAGLQLQALKSLHRFTWGDGFRSRRAIVDTL